MSQGKGDSRSILRLLLWEGLAAAGLVYIRLHPYADRIWDSYFSSNALFFIAAYPVLFFQRWKMSDGCLGIFLGPLSFALKMGLGLSSYLWTAYLLLINNSPYFYAISRHMVPLGVLFALIYFPLIQPILGVGRKYASFGQLVLILIWSVMGGAAGYETGWLLGQKFPAIRVESGRWFIFWLAIVFLGTAVGALIAHLRTPK